MPHSTLTPEQYRRFLSLVAAQCGCRLTRFDPAQGTVGLVGCPLSLRRCRARLLAVAGDRDRHSAAGNSR